MSKTYFSAIAIVTLAFMLGGCASATVDATKPSRDLPRPDKVIIDDFAVTPAEVELDKGIAASIYRDGQGPQPTSEEVQVGHLVAQKLSSRLVAKLNSMGIPAVREGPGVHATSTSVVLTGQFEKVSQGNQTERVWVGFGLGGSQLRARGVMLQDGKMISQGVATTTASLKPGMLASGAAAVATGGAAPLAVGAGTTGYSEAFTAGVEADASRMADAIAKKTKNYYLSRGWLSE